MSDDSRGIAFDAHFFRHEYARLVAMLVRRLGAKHLELVEDAVQSALLAAVEAWPRSDVPDNPSAWLYRVALNHATSELRSRARREALALDHASSESPAFEPDERATLSGDVGDDLLRMLFVCCDEALSLDAQLALALKTLCGFEVREIAERLFVSEASVYKRLARAREKLRDDSQHSLHVRDLSTAQLASRLSAVHVILYTLFTEGYLSSHGDNAIRRDLCDEATRLATLVSEHHVGATPETFALLALMHLHNARMPARQDGSGGMLLLEEQDRSRWNLAEIQRGLTFLARSVEGDHFSRFHAEAGVAAEHCLAPSFAETRWDRVVACYELLDRVAPSALHTLNRAVAMAELHDAHRALAMLEGLAPPTWLEGSFQWSAVLSDLHRRAGHTEIAERYRAQALSAAPSTVIRDALARRLG